MLSRNGLIAAALFVALGAHSAESLPRSDAQTAVRKAHKEIWRRFVDKHNIVLDYTDLDGSYRRPTPEDCREQKPSALSWGVPVEDGPMFNGLCLDAMCNRWKLTRNALVSQHRDAILDVISHYRYDRICNATMTNNRAKRPALLMRRHDLASIEERR